MHYDNHNDKVSCVSKFKSHQTILSESKELKTNPNTITKENMLYQILINIFSSCFCLLCIFLVETINLAFMGKTAKADLNIDSVG